MATITLEYNGRNGFAQKLIDTVLASKLFAVVEPHAHKETRNKNFEKTLKAIDEIKSGKVIHCKTFEDYKNAVK